MCGWFFFFFQAEDGIRDIGVTGVQTCALPIYGAEYSRNSELEFYIFMGNHTGIQFIFTTSLQFYIYNYIIYYKTDLTVQALIKNVFCKAIKISNLLLW